MRNNVVVGLQLFRIAYSYSLFSYEDQINIITPVTLSVFLLYLSVVQYTDKKENRIVLICKEIQMGSGA